MYRSAAGVLTMLTASSLYQSVTASPEGAHRYIEGAYWYIGGAHRYTEGRKDHL